MEEKKQCIYFKTLSSLSFIVVSTGSNISMDESWYMIILKKNNQIKALRVVDSRYLSFSLSLCFVFLSVLLCMHVSIRVFTYAKNSLACTYTVNLQRLSWLSRWTLQLSWQYFKGNKQRRCRGETGRIFLTPPCDVSSRCWRTSVPVLLKTRPRWRR